MRISTNSADVASGLEARRLFTRSAAAASSAWLMAFVIRSITSSIIPGLCDLAGAFSFFGAVFEELSSEEAD
jgi:hypothetical protein